MNDVNASGLKTVGTEPYVGETPQAALDRWLTPNSLFYVRSQFDYPKIDESSWQLEVTETGSQEIALTLDELKHLPKHIPT